MYHLVSESYKRRSELTEQKISSPFAAAVMSEELVLTHKVVFPAGAPPERSSNNSAPLSGTGQETAAHNKERVCFYCETGHIIANCLVLKRKGHNLTAPTTEAAWPKVVGVVNIRSDPDSSANGSENIDKLVMSRLGSC